MTALLPPREIYTISGNCNCIIVVPDGHSATTSSPLCSFAHGAIKGLGAYGIINQKYKKTIINLLDTEQILKRQRIKQNFLHPLQQFKEEIINKEQTALLLILQLVDNFPGPSDKLDLLIGAGQGERRNSKRPHRPSFQAFLLKKFQQALSEGGFSSELAPVESQFCGREEEHLNQFFSLKKSAGNQYDSKVQSLLLTLQSQALGQDGKITEKLGRAFGKTLLQFVKRLPVTRQVKLNSIQVKTSYDQQYNFRLCAKKSTESTRSSGFQDPLVLLQKDTADYKILCGFCRYQALKRANTDRIAARIYQESAFNKEDLFHISLAENSKRRRLNPIEIGIFLERAASDLCLNNVSLAEKFAQVLFSGRPGQKTPQSTIANYRGIGTSQFREESPDIVDDIINGELQFTIATKILAPIKDPQSRNLFYNEIIKTFDLLLPQIIMIKKLLTAKNTSLAAAIQSQEVQQTIINALLSEDSSTTFICQLEKNATKQENAKNLSFEKKANHLCAVISADNLSKKDIAISRSENFLKKEIILHLTIRKDNLQEISQSLNRLEKAKKDLLGLLEGEL